MSYLVLARKYRPKQFTELVGQQHVSTTLLNSFKQNKLGQAYLLTGTRGVGKTSAARIFAKALRCENPDSQPGGKNPGISCDKCPSCLEINAGNSIDVLEIDGASNNGVENVREIREQVKFLPSRGKVKVYIIDEVHMLTSAAFNALLKTLEEPPPHVTFLLATTEIQKIPSTILSRCQRFDFRRVAQKVIVEHLNSILSKEGITAEQTALQLIARKGDGSLRDSLSALDQCLSMGDKNLTAAVVTEALSLVGQVFVIKLLQEIFLGSVSEASQRLQKAYYSGIEMKQLATEICEALRNALYVKLGAAEALEISQEENEELEKLVASLSSEVLQAAFKVMSTALEDIWRSPIPKTHLEMALMRLPALAKLTSMETLFQQLSGAGAALPNQAPSAPAPQAPMPLTKPAFYPPPTAAASDAQKKSPPGLNTEATPFMANNPSAISAPSGPADGKERNLEGFVPFVLEKKASLGALLEHALSITDSPWQAGTTIKIGFRKSHSFFQLQAQHKANLEQLEKLLTQYLGAPTKLTVETIVDSAPVAGKLASKVEKEKKNAAMTAAEKKQKFLSLPIVKDTKEIFGVDLSSFDIEKV